MKNINYQEIYEKLLKKIEEYSKELKEDSKLDKSNLESSFQLAELISKWIDRKVELYKIVYRLEKSKKQKYKELWEFYKMDYEISVKSKSELDLLIESDNVYTQILNAVNMAKEIIKFIETAIDILKLKHWERRDYIEYLKFINGN